MLDSLNTGQKIMLTMLLFGPVAISLLLWAIWPVQRIVLYALAGAMLADMAMAGWFLWRFLQQNRDQ
jgi:hypothetical protein